MAGALNPMFFIGIPLGWYWLRSNRKDARTAAGAMSNVPRPNRETAQVGVVPPAVRTPAEGNSQLELGGPATRTDWGGPPAEAIGCAIACLVSGFLVLLIGFAIEDDGRRENGTGIPDLDRAPTEEKAIALVERFGGNIHRRGTGSEITSVELVGAPVNDGDLAMVLGFERLQSLDVSETDVSDASVDTILKLKHLRRLRADGTGITHAGFKRLREEGRFVLAESGRYEHRSVPRFKGGRLLEERPCIDPIDVRELEHGSKEVWLTTRPMTE